MQILSFGSQAGDHRLFFLHGFPGIRSRQNRDIAEIVAQRTGYRADVLLYDGLGFAPGSFAFEQCLQNVREYIAAEIAEGVRSFDLIGHSWGGFQSLVLAREHEGRLRRLVLMSPLLRFAEASLCASAIANHAAQNPQLRLGDPEVRAQDFVRVGERHAAVGLVRDVPESAEVLFLQSREDTITPTSVARELLPHFRRPPVFELLETDHSFLALRPEIAARIAGFLGTRS